MTDVAKLQLIEAHHNGTLSPSEADQIQQLLSEDPNFASELEDYQLLLDGFDMLELEVFEKQLHCWETKHQEASKTIPMGVEITDTPEQKKRSFFGRYLSIAAAVAVLLFVPITYYTTMGAGSDVFNDMYETPTAFVVRGEATDNKDQAFTLAMSIYNKGAYNKAIELLNTYIDQYGQQEYEAIFYLASAQMAEGEYRQASMNFEHVAEQSSGKSFYQNQAEWYLLLAQYKLGNESVAKKLANRIIANPKHNFHKEAKLFLEKIQ